MRIHMVTMVGYSVTTLPHLLEHYARAGVSSFWVFVHELAGREHVVEEVKRLCGRYEGAKLFAVGGEWLQVQRSVWSVMQNYPDDWFVVVDQDEFQLYPDDLAKMTIYCDANGYDYVCGALVDRIAEDGRLAALKADADLWSQYPIGALLTVAICGGNYRKVAVAKGKVKFVNEGHHDAINGVGCPVNDLSVEVHHFKWIDGVAEYLGDRSGNSLVRAESLRFLWWYEQHGRRIPLEHAGLFAARCDPRYPHWDFMRNMMLVADLSRRSYETYAQRLSGGQTHDISRFRSE